MTDDEHKERIAVMEHRQDSVEKNMAKVEKWMEQITESLKTLVKVQADQAHTERALTRLHERLDAEILARRDQHEQTRFWADENRGALSSNTSWISILKAIALAFMGGLIGGAINHLLSTGGMG